MAKISWKYYRQKCIWTLWTKVFDFPQKATVCT
jgi:hypothetical protein